MPANKEEILEMDHADLFPELRILSQAFGEADLDPREAAMHIRLAMPLLSKTAKRIRRQVLLSGGFALYYFYSECADLGIAVANAVSWVKVQRAAISSSATKAGDLRTVESLQAAHARFSYASQVAKHLLFIAAEEIDNNSAPEQDRISFRARSAIRSLTQRFDPLSLSFRDVESLEKCDDVRVLEAHHADKIVTAFSSGDEFRTGSLAVKAILDEVVDLLEADHWAMVNWEPRWDQGAKQLWFRGQLVKQIERAAKNQTLVLQVLQEEGWPTRIDSPLPRAVDIKDTIRSLNENLTGGMEFHRDGEGIRWSWA